MYDIRSIQSLLAISALLLLTGAKGSGCPGSEDPDPTPGTGGGSATTSSGGSGTGAGGSAGSGGGSGGSGTGVGGSAGSGGSGGGCGEPPPGGGTPAPLGCYLFTDLSALPDDCESYSTWDTRSEEFCNAQYPVGGFIDGIIPGPLCDDPGGARRPEGIECCPNSECCWNGAGFGFSDPAYCPGVAVAWELCQGQPSVCCDTAGGPTFQPVCACDATSALPQEACSVCCRHGVQLDLSRPEACAPAQVMPSSWCAPGSGDLVRLRSCGLAHPCGSSFEIGGGGYDGEYPEWNLCILEFLASGAAGYVEAEDSGDFIRREYIYVQGPEAAIWQRFFDGDGDHPPTIPAPPVQCVLKPPSYFATCLTSYAPACERPENWFVSCSSTPITACP